MVLLSAEGVDVGQIAEVAFTSEDRVGEVTHNFNDEGFDSLYPRYASSPCPERRLHPAHRPVLTHRPRPCLLHLVALQAGRFPGRQGGGQDISHEGLRSLLREEGVSFQRLKTWKKSNDPDFEAKEEPHPRALRHR